MGNQKKIEVPDYVISFGASSPMSQLYTVQFADGLYGMLSVYDGRYHGIIASRQEGLPACDSAEEAIEALYRALHRDKDEHETS
ncbi:MAG: hypothetical protein J5771_04700 [Bacteroidales bacterium]|nr:hypothetical protein [Bacteroidales bacterium]